MWIVMLVTPFAAIVEYLENHAFNHRNVYLLFYWNMSDFYGTPCIMMQIRSMIEVLAIDVKSRPATSQDMLNRALTWHFMQDLLVVPQRTWEKPATQLGKYANPHPNRNDKNCSIPVFKSSFALWKAGNRVPHTLIFHIPTCQLLQQININAKHEQNYDSNFVIILLWI